MNEAALARARQSWQAAEARLYPLAMTDVDGYQRALVLVAAVRDELRAVTTTSADLLACQAEADRLLTDASAATGASVRGLHADDVFGSAAAARDREMAQDQRRGERMAALERGRATGEEWVDLHAGSLGPLVPELRIHVATGWAILTSLSADATTGAPVFLLAPVLVDPATGDLREEGGNEVEAARSPGEWGRIAAALQVASRGQTDR